MTKGVIALMGSGETAPSMTKVHRQLLSRLDAVNAVVLDTSYAFQTNVPQMTEKILDYFSTSLRLQIRPLHFGDVTLTTPVEQAIYRQEVSAANYVFAGPGSPSYALRQWSQAGIKASLESVVTNGGVLCFASAAALTLGTYTAPIYEIYKAGATSHWLDGLDTLSLIGVKCAIVPHYDNAEGGNYDTRYCYLGETRLTYLESQLPDDAGVLGIDEHTAAVIDLATDTISVFGRSNAYWRRRGVTTVLEKGSQIPLNTIRTYDPVSNSTVENQTSQSDLESLTSLAIAGGPTGVEAIAELSRRAVRTSDSALDPAPLVERLLALRSEARANNDFGLSDEIRRILTESGIDVMDGVDGSHWTIR